MNNIKFTVLAFIVVLMTACSSLSMQSDSSRRNVHLSNLSNKGIVLLSQTNPYLAPNMLVSGEMDRHPEVAGFVKYNGVPSAIEVRDVILFPTKVTFYYPNELESYELVDNNGSWVINGPLPLSEDRSYKLAALVKKDKQIALNPITAPGIDNKLQKAHDEFFFANDEREMKASLHNKSKVEDVSSDSKKNVVTPQVKKQAANDKVNIDQIISKYGKGSVEITPKGDIVHYVTYSGETMSIISRWYTKEVSNAGKIARMNNITSANQLNIGDIVIIPAYMAHNKKRLTKDALSAIQSAIK